MAGMKGRSGGARPNSGPKPKPPVLTATSVEDSDASEFLIKAMKDTSIDVKLRIDAAKALLPYQCQKIGDAGKKEEKDQSAKKAGAGKFASAPPPLKLVNAR